MSNRGSLRIAVEDFLAALKVGERVKKAGLEFLENLEDEAAEAAEDLNSALGLNPLIPPALKPKSGIAAKKKRPAWFLGIAAMIIAPIWGAIQGYIEPFRREVLQEANRQQKNEILGLASILQAWRRQPAIRDVLKDWFHKHGVADYVFDILELTTRQHVAPGELMALLNRGRVNPEFFRQELRGDGWEDRHIDYLLELAHVIPPIQDLIRFAVRDAFNPAAIERFRLDEGFPRDIVPHARSQGLSEEWVHKYWQSHWNLPSPTQAFEMLHRLRPGRSNVPFTQADLQQYLITADIPAFFRERLTQIAYNPLTRVDVRRMYGVGVLDREGVKNAYLDLGMSDRDAENLTLFTERFERSDERDLTREAIQTGYRRSYLTRDVSIEQLKRMGYDDFEAAFWLDMVDYEEALKERDEELDRIKLLYVEGIIDDSTATGELGRLNLRGQEQAAILNNWRRARRSRIQVPSRSDLEDWFKHSVINEQDFRQAMSERGFREGDTERYLKKIAIELEDASRKELERAQKESERLEAARIASGFTKTLAAKDVDIAEAKLAIASVKLAMLNVASSDEIGDLQERQRELEEFIAEVQLEKAQVKLQREERKQ